MNALKRVRNIRSGDKLKATANLLEAPLSTFKELESDVVTRAPVALDVIFVHGLGTKGAADIRRRLKTWLRAIPKAEGLLGCRVWRFGFDGKELLAEGRPRLMDLARSLLKEVQRLTESPPSQAKTEPAKSDRKLVFLGYGAAGWVIQEALAWYSNTSTETARRTAMVILLNLGIFDNKEAFKTYLDQCPPALFSPGKDKVRLEFDLVNLIQKNFKQLVGSKTLGPWERRITILDPRATPSPTQTSTLTAHGSLQNDSVLRRETSDTHHTTDSTGSNTTDSSKDSSSSSTVLNNNPIPLWEIKSGDATDGEIRSLLKTALMIEKSDDDDTMAQPHGQPAYEPVAPTYGGFEASKFGFRKVNSGLSTKSSRFYAELKLPRRPHGGSQDRSAKVANAEPPTIIEESHAVGNVRNYLEKTSHIEFTTPYSSTDEVYIESTPEKDYTPAWEDHADTTSETLEIGQDVYTEKEPFPKDVPTPTPSAAHPRQLLTLASLYQQSGELQKSQALYQRLLKLPSMEKGIDIIMTQIAITWIYEGRVKKAQKVFSDLEPRVEAEFKREPQRTWEVKRWLAITLDMQGLYESGRQKLMNISGAFTSFQQAQQFTDVGLLARSTLALLFGHLGKYEEALTRSEEVLRLAENAVKEAKEGDSASMTRHRGALGSIQFDRAKILTYVGRYKDAEALNNQALENIQRNVGSKHVSTLECWSLKARHLASTCRLPEAEEQCQKTLKVMRKEIGKEHPSTLKTLGVLVFVYRLQARFTEALETAKYLFEKCKASEAFGENHPETINSMWQLAEVYLARGDFSNALHYQGQAVQLADKVLGKVHPTVVNYRACLARVYCNRGNWTHSASLCFDVLDNYVSIISETLQGKNKNIQKVQKPSSTDSELKEGHKSVIQQALEKARAILFNDSDDFETLNLSLASTIQCLGVTERERQHGDLEIAQELQTKAHEYIEKTLGDDHADTLSSKWDLALTKLKRGQNGALRELADVTASRRRLLGEDHPDTLAARHQLSVAKFDLSGNEKELSEQAEVLRLCIHLLGDEHPTTNSARVDLSTGYHSAGRLTDAEQLRLKALKVQLKTLPHPDLTKRARVSYTEALRLIGLLQDFVSDDDTELELKGIEKSKDETSEPASKHCHAQIIASLAALALIYVDMAQSADETALASVQESDPESEQAHQDLVSQFNEKAIALQCAVVDQHGLLDEDRNMRKERWAEDVVETQPQEWLDTRCSRETLESINTLGLIYQAAGETDAAIEQCELVLQNADESSILHLKSQSNLGALLFAAGEFDKAEEIQEAAYDKRRRFGKDVVGDKEFVIAGFNLAFTKEALGKKKEALRFMREALKLSREAFGHGDPTTVRILDTWTEWSEAFGDV